MRYVKKLGYRSQDYAVEIINSPESCNNCNCRDLPSLQIQDDPEIFFISETYPTEKKPIILKCENCQSVSRGFALVHIAEIWINEEMKKHDFSENLSEKEERYLLLLRGLFSKIDAKGRLTQLEPTNELLQNTFLPGSFYSADIWISDEATIEKGVILNPPLLIGKNCIIKKGSICGPNSIIVENSIINESEKIESSVIVDSIMVQAL